MSMSVGMIQNVEKAIKYLMRIDVSLQRIADALERIDEREEKRDEERKQREEDLLWQI